MRRPSLLPALLLAALPAAPALAQDPATDPKCATVRPAFPAGFGGWSTRAPLSAGASPRTAPVLAIGRGADLTLHPLAQVAPVARWGKPPAADAAAGLAMFQVAHAGTYRVALGTPTWVDVVRAGTALPAQAHGHGPACTGIRKIVDFRLKPGRYVLQLSGGGATTVPVLIVRGAA